MSDVAKGWYPDPADRSVQRYWDGEGWVGDPLPVDASPGEGPPPASTPAEAAVLEPRVPQSGVPQSGVPHVGAAVSRSGTSAPPRHPHSQPGPHSQLGPQGQPGPHQAGPQGQPGPHQAGPYSQPGPGRVPYRYPVPMPAPRPHGYPLAPVASRLVARIIDTLAVLGLCLAVNWWLAYQFWQQIRPYIDDAIRRADLGQQAAPATAIPSRANWLLIAMLVVAVALWFAYEVPAMANDGQTLGKRAMHIKVVRLESVEPLGFRRAWRRWNTLGLPTLLWSFWFVGFLLQLVDCLFVAVDRPLHQALHDRSAATVVVGVGPSNRGGPK